MIIYCTIYFRMALCVRRFVCMRMKRENVVVDNEQGEDDDNDDKNADDVFFIPELTTVTLDACMREKKKTHTRLYVRLRKHARIQLPHRSASHTRIHRYGSTHAKYSLCMGTYVYNLYRAHAQHAHANAERDALLCYVLNCVSRGCCERKVGGCPRCFSSPGVLK